VRFSTSLIVAVLAAVAVVAALFAPAAASTFSVQFEFDGGITSGEEIVFSQAAAYWNSIITGYRVAGTHSVTVYASGAYIDGVGGVLGSTSVIDTVRRTAPDGVTYHQPTDATMAFDSADLDNMYSQGYLYPVIVHEVAHAIGFGTVWNLNTGVYTDGTGRYTGTSALAAYRSEFSGQSAAAYVPVELGGGIGTADGHWNENDGGAGATGIVDSRNRDMQFELMTGWLNLPGSSEFISQTTIHSFEDLGYTVLKLPGDANQDGFVDGADLNTVLSNYNSSGMDWAHGDFNGDGVVNGADLNLLLSDFNQNNGIYGLYGPPGGGSALMMAVPEPDMGWLVLGLAAASLARHCRKRR
jgi:hypothetical protein